MSPLKIEGYNPQRDEWFHVGEVQATDPKGTLSNLKEDEASKPRQSFQFYYTHESVNGEITNSGIIQSENGYTNDVAEWVNLEGALNIELRHSVDIKTILTAYHEKV